MIPALLGKELQQHGPALVGALVLVVAITVVTWAMGLQEDWVTLLEAAQAVVWLGVPPLVLFLAGRQVVHDHRAGTHEFVAALPISPLMHALVRFTLGLTIVLAVTAVVLGATALLASRREGVPPSFVLQLSVQLGLYSATWYALAFGLAHLGRYRWLAWWLVFATLPVAEVLSDSPGRDVYWFGLVLDGADRTRLDPPWEALPLTIAWGLGGLALGLSASTWRGGILVERWFRPSTAHQRAQLIGVGVAAVLVTEACTSLAPSTDPWATLPAAPAERAVVRAAASEGSPLQRIGSEVAQELDGLAAALEVPEWPPVVLLASRGTPGRPPVRLAPTDHEQAIVLLVDPEHPRVELMEHILAAAIAHRLSGLQDWDPSLRWVVDGLAPWWLGRDRTVQASAGQGRVEDALKDWHAVRRELGTAAPAVAWAGLMALEDLGGRPAVLRVARHVLTPRVHTRWPSAASLGRRTRSGWVPRTAEVDPTAWTQAWEARMPTRGAAPPAFPPLDVGTEGGETVASWVGLLPRGSRVEWVHLDALQRAPLPWDERGYVDPGDGSEVAIPIDSRARVAARFVGDDPTEGRRVGPWSVHP